MPTEIIVPDMAVKTRELRVQHRAALCASVYTFVCVSFDYDEVHTCAHSPVHIQGVFGPESLVGHGIRRGVIHFREEVQV